MDFHPAFTSVLSGLLVHLYFNRLEPRKPFLWLALMFGIPAFTTTFAVSSLPKYNAFGYIFSVLVHNSTLIMSTIFYRLSPFHPLAGYSGPLLARISSLYMTKMAIGGKRHVLATELHRKYGTHVRIGPNAVSVADVNGLRELLGPNGMPKPEHFIWSSIAPLNLISSDCISLPNHTEEHAMRRKAWNQAFTGTSLREYDTHINDRVSLLVKRLEEHAQVGSAVDLGKWVGYFTFDVMGDIIFGGGFDMLKDEDREGMWQVILSSVSVLNVMSTNAWAGHIVPYLPTGKDTVRMIAFAEACTKMRMRRGSMAKDLFYYLTDESAKSSLSLSEKQLADEMYIGIIAGSDTTSSVVSNTLFSLLSNPPILTKLRKEIEAEFGHEDPTDDTKLANMPYLNAVINETLRLYPALPFSLTRTPEKASGGAVVAGRFVPEGTSVWFPICTIQRDARYFAPDPELFWPERWLSSEGDDGVTKHDRDAFIPFSLGPANCVGRHLAYREMRAVVSTIVQRFDMAFEVGYEPSEWEESLRDEYVMVKGRLPVRLTRRN